MSEELRSALYAQLKTVIEGKSQKDAANILLNFVQTAFEYKTDGDQFGFEKPNFPDETFYNPCSGGRLSEEITGDYVVLDDGSKYLICDPTYIGAPIGMCMDQYKQVAPEIIR